MLKQIGPQELGLSLSNVMSHWVLDLLFSCWAKGFKAGGLHINVLMEGASRCAKRVDCDLSAGRCERLV